MLSLLIATFHCREPARSGALAEERRIGEGDGGGAQTRRQSPCRFCPAGLPHAPRRWSGRRRVGSPFDPVREAERERTRVLIATFQFGAPARCGGTAGPDASLRAGRLVAGRSHSALARSASAFAAHGLTLFG